MDCPPGIVLPLHGRQHCPLRRARAVAPARAARCMSAKSAARRTYGATRNDSQVGGGGKPWRPNGRAPSAQQAARAKASATPSIERLIHVRRAAINQVFEISFRFHRSAVDVELNRAFGR